VAQFPETLKLDTTKITVCGHSFGGITSIRLAQLDERVKCVLAIDPWLFLHLDDIEAGALKLGNIPLFSLNTEDFDTICYYDNNKYTKRLFDLSISEHKKYFIFERIHHRL
jgi:pimeloyl-ACP methyl ester carboxylesterase